MRLYIPYTDQREVEEVAKVLATGYLTQGPKVAEFEVLIRDMIGARHAFAMSSCTTALHLSLAALDIGPGDDVLVSDFTFPATGNVVVQAGARPVLVDIRTDTYNLDVADLERKLTPQTRAHHARACLRPLRRHGADHGLRPTPQPGGDRGCGVRAGRHLPRPVLRHDRRPGLLQLPPAQIHHHRRGRHDRNR